VNGPEIHKLIEDNLRAAIARLGPLPDPQPIPSTPWVTMSLLQKSIRRGREDLALRAAATLLWRWPDRLWRRLGCIAAEDIGLGSVEALGITTAALTGKKFRADLGGAWPVARCVVSELVRAPKCRAADDLLTACADSPAYAADRDALRGLPSRELVEIACGAGLIQERALALRFALGEGPRGLGLTRRWRDAPMVFERLCEAGWPHSMVEVASLGFRRTGESLSPCVALLSREFAAPTTIEPDEMPPETMIGSAPSWAYDIFTREGRAAYANFLRTDARAAAWLRRHVPAGRRVKFLGHIVFRVEGGLVDRRLRWPLADTLRREADVECSAPECFDATEILDLVRGDVPALNEARLEVVGGGSYDL
jgi:hypothetical protein